MTDATKKQDIIAPVQPRMQSISAKIIRCGCTDDQKLRNDWHGKEFAGRQPFPCPNPRVVEDKGIISYWHRNPFKRLVYRFRRTFNLPHEAA